MNSRNAVLGGGIACERPHWGLRWSSLWGHETMSWAGGPHANTTTGAFVGPPMGPRNAALGGGPACEHPQWGLRWTS
eukprot:1791326-Pyramimonas_sp.AAC.1